ncbi:hypothetical protein CERSUDRAFT_101118, partial [Gelatoporia subvermispora B]
MSSHTCPDPEATDAVRRGEHARKPARIALDPNNVERSKIPGVPPPPRPPSPAPALPTSDASILPVPSVSELTSSAPNKNLPHDNTPQTRPSTPSVSPSPPAPSLFRSKRPIVISDEDSVADNESNPAVGNAPRKAQKKRKTKRQQHAQAQDEVNEDGFLKDLAHLDADLAEHEDELSDSADVYQFFENRRARPNDKNSSKEQKVHDCVLCKKKNTAKFTFVTDVSTARRHLAAFHKASYYKWCKQHHFKSMLKDDIAARAACRKNTQPTLDPHMQALPPKDTAIPYSDGQLRSAAITWMITTDQV